MEGDMYCSSGNVVERVLTQARLVELWPFFQEGLDQLNDPRRAGMDETPEVFFKQLGWIVHNKSNSALIVVKSKKEKPLGFAAGYQTTPIFAKNKVFFIYVVYSNGKNKNTVSDVLDIFTNIAKGFGLTEFQTATGRFSGAAFRWFEKKLGFERRFMVFRKLL